ncbi:MAG: cation transporter [Candidatus Bathyarchaeota archaeon]|nr:cation diffusion facilitator family transporter [Candidatus Bathyarchaeum tardum]WGM88613.1 MAG: cation diffusion facilitator family transporter [Candidatus Bathyarchaeum tardum]WNZ29131.1 MAG: cation transporter [Candidatus Bathyarchaeota archaeon]
MEKKQVAVLAVFCGVAIFAIKLVAYFLSNSVALLSDALESIVNIVSSALMLFSVCVSERAPDRDHKYGHEKVEDISSLLQGFLILIAAALIIYAAAGRLFESIELLQLDFAIGVSIFATVLNGLLSLLLIRTAKSCGSTALEGSAKHLFSDVISTAGVWIGLVVAQLTGWNFLDSVLAFIVSALVVRVGLKLIFKSSNRLMDQSCTDEENKIIEVLDRHAYHFIDFHNLKTRRHGNQVFAELHLSVDGSLSVQEAHDLTDHLADEIKEEQPNVKMTIHVEPPKNK